MPAPASLLPIPKPETGSAPSSAGLLDITPEKPGVRAHDKDASPRSDQGKNDGSEPLAKALGSQPDVGPTGASSPNQGTRASGVHPTNREPTAAAAAAPQPGQPSEAAPPKGGKVLPVSPIQENPWGFAPPVVCAPHVHSPEAEQSEDTEGQGDDEEDDEEFIDRCLSDSETGEADISEYETGEEEASEGSGDDEGGEEQAPEQPAGTAAKAEEVCLPYPKRARRSGSASVPNEGKAAEIAAKAPGSAPPACTWDDFWKTHPVQRYGAAAGQQGSSQQGSGAQESAEAEEPSGNPQVGGTQPQCRSSHFTWDGVDEQQEATVPAGATRGFGLSPEQTRIDALHTLQDTLVKLAADAAGMDEAEEQAAAEAARLEKVPGEEEEEGAHEDGDDDEDGANAQTFAQYRPSKVKLGKPHPDAAVETTSLSAVEPPNPMFELRIAGGRPPTVPAPDLRGTPAANLSCLQLETVTYACQRHEHILEDGKRSGFLLGDGAGMGKGRTVAGIILENWMRGRSRHVWMSVGPDLKFDAQRNLDDIGATNVPVLPLPSSYAPISTPHGVLFFTYHGLRSKGKHGPRIDQIVEWCGGEDFDGVLIFDECHKAKNLLPSAGQGPSKGGTLAGKAVLDLQERLPNARVVYCSATGASEIRHLAYMTRMGLWGPSTPFKDFLAFQNSIDKKGMAALELVAMDMKARGMYMCRTLSFQGAEFEVVNVDLEPRMKEMYTQAVHFWVDLRLALKALLEECEETPSMPKPRAVWAMFWSAHQRFFRSMCIAAKVQSTVLLAKQALEEGKCVVIGLQSTGEARTEEMVARHGTELDDWVSGPKEQLRKLVLDFFPPVYPRGEEEEEWSNDMDLPGGMGGEEAQRKAKILEAIKTLQLPTNPLDQLLHELGGPAKVAEMTGRKGVLVRKDSEGEDENDGDERGRGGCAVVYQQRKTNVGTTTDLVNVKEKEHFMNGEKLVAIISEAASVGISLQADKRKANQRRRVHITIELPWSADRAIQQFGRTHRSNQSSAPQYRLLFTELGGERRFASIVAKRLESLGALTQGDRRAQGMSLAEFNFDSKWGKQALSIMYSAIQGFSQPPLPPPGCPRKGNGNAWEPFFKGAQAALIASGIIDDTAAGIATAQGLGEEMDTSGKISENNTTDVRRFLNRILGLVPGVQDALFRYFTALFAHSIKQAKLRGHIERGVLLIKKATEVSQRQVIHSHSSTDGASMEQTLQYSFQSDRGLSWAEAKEVLRKGREDATAEAAADAAAQKAEDDAVALLARKRLCTGLGDGKENRQPEEVGLRKRLRKKNVTGIDGFYVSHNAAPGGHKPLALITTHGAPERQVLVYRPYNNVPTRMFIAEMRYKYRKLPEEGNFSLTASMWRKNYDRSKTECQHGAKCRLCSTCTVGRRTMAMHVITGAIFPLWDMLVHTHAAQTLKGHQNFRIVQVMRGEDADGSAGDAVADAQSGRATVGLCLYADGIKVLHKLIQAKKEGGTALASGLAAVAHRALSRALIPTPGLYAVSSAQIHRMESMHRRGRGRGRRGR